MAPEAKADYSSENSQPPRPQSILGEGKIYPKSADMLKFEERLKRDMERINEMLAKDSELITPEVQEIMLEGSMYAAEPHYFALFASWGIETPTAEETLKIIRERNRKINELRGELFREGLDHVGTFAKKRKAAEELAEKQLAPLLGRTRFEELSKVERELEAATIEKEISKARERLRRLEQ